MKTPATIHNPIKAKFLTLLPFLSAILLMLPRITSAQFGLLDDGLTIKVTRLMASEFTFFLQESATGRFRPMYWLFYRLQAALFGKQPGGYFWINLILLLATLAILMWLVSKWTNNMAAASLSGLLFVFSGASVENYYTLSKPEPLQTFFLVLLVALLFESGRSYNQGIIPLFATGLLLLSFCFSVLLKETTLIMVFVFGAALAWYWRRHAFILNQRRRMVIIFVGLILLGSGFFWLRSNVMQATLTGGHYTQNYQFSPAVIMVSSIRWFNWLIKDYASFLPLLFFFYFKPDWLKTSPVKTLLGASLVWMIVWIGIYLPWMYVSGYYLLPFSLGASIFGALLAWSVYSRWRVSRGGEKILSSLALITSLLLSLLSVATNLSAAAVQLAVDRVNAELIATLATELGDEPVVYANYLATHEYIEEMNLHLQELEHAETPKIESLDDLGQTGRPTTPYYVLNNVVKNAPPLSVRLGIYDHEAGEREENFLANNKAVIKTEIGQTVNVFYFDLLRLFCNPSRPSIFCQEGDTKIGLREFRFAWKIYQTMP